MQFVQWTKSNKTNCWPVNTEQSYMSSKTIETSYHSKFRKKQKKSFSSVKLYKSYI